MSFDSDNCQLHYSHGKLLVFSTKEGTHDPKEQIAYGGS